MFPILVVSPAYLTGAIPLGALMQAHLTFQRVEGAFAFCIGAYPKIAEWKAIVDRLAQFEAAMEVVDRYRDPLAKIEFVPAAGSELAIDHLAVRLASGEPIATVPDVTLAPGDGLLVSGPSGSGKSSLFRALAGLWPLGDGTIRLPAGAHAGAAAAALLPARHAAPGADLPDACRSSRRHELREAMAAAGLGHLARRLDEEAEWSAVLSGGEQQRVAFARALIAQPSVLLLDEAVTTLEEADGAELYRMIAQRLPDTIVISIGRPALLSGQHRRAIVLDGAPASSRGVAPMLATA